MDHSPRGQRSTNCPGGLPCSAVLAAFHVVRSPPRADTHAALLGLFATVLVNALLTNGIKIMVRRRRTTNRCH